jgi:hypothetical protein
MPLYILKEPPFWKGDSAFLDHKIPLLAVYHIPEEKEGEVLDFSDLFEAYQSIDNFPAPVVYFEKCKAGS